MENVLLKSKEKIWDYVQEILFCDSVVKNEWVEKRVFGFFNIISQDLLINPGSSNNSTCYMDGGLW